MEDAIKLTDDYYLTSDGKMNLTLLERYEKREGRGKHAELSGEFAFREDGYFRNLKHVGNYLVDKEVYKYEGSEMEGIVDRVEKLREEILGNLTDKIVIEWKN